MAVLTKVRPFFPLPTMWAKRAGDRTDTSCWKCLEKKKILMLHNGPICLFSPFGKMITQPAFFFMTGKREWYPWHQCEEHACAHTHTHICLKTVIKIKYKTTEVKHTNTNVVKPHWQNRRALGQRRHQSVCNTKDHDAFLQADEGEDNVSKTLFFFLSAHQIQLKRWIEVFRG